MLKRGSLIISLLKIYCVLIKDTEDEKFQHLSARSEKIPKFHSERLDTIFMKRMHAVCGISLKKDAYMYIK